MVENRPTREFGKRRPEPLPPKQPIKRSAHVAHLVMGTIAVGTTAYVLMPRQNCDSPSPGTAAPAQTSTSCSDRGWSSSAGHGGGSSSRSSHYGSDSSSNHSSSGTSFDSGSVTRGGFGSFAHGLFSGGG